MNPVHAGISSSSRESAPSPPQRLCLPNRRLLVLQNPGRGSRNYLEGIIAGLRRLGVEHYVLELEEIWATSKADPRGIVLRLSRILVEQRIGAVLGYGFNGISDFHSDEGPVANIRSFFEVRAIPHLMLWLDHPEWHADRVGLNPQLQGMFRSANCVHLLKNSGHALEMERIAGWPNCFVLPAGFDPDQFPLSEKTELASQGTVKPEFDLVAICSEKGELPSWLAEFARLDDPNPGAIRRIILNHVRKELEQLWREAVPEPLRKEVTELGLRWSAMKAEFPFAAAVRHWPALTQTFPSAAWHLTMAYPTYMNALRILWKLREWERRFYLAYLSRYVRVSVFGGDWSGMKLGPGGWVDFRKQAETYARGRVALNITDGHDEEGLTVKPFEIAASGVPMLHYRADGPGGGGLADCFEIGKEVEVFERPLEARIKLEALLEDSEKRRAMAQAARTRALRDHTWERRIERIFLLARLPIENFQVNTQTGAAAARHPFTVTSAAS